VACIDELNTALKAAPALRHLQCAEGKNPGITGVTSGEDLLSLDAPSLKRLASRTHAHHSPMGVREFLD
jgi:hypothetical protein